MLMLYLNIVSTYITKLVSTNYVGFIEFNYEKLDSFWAKVNANEVAFVPIF